MQTYETGKVYNAGGYLIASGVTVVIDIDRVMIGGTVHPIADVTIHREKRTIESPNGWTVSY